MIFDEATSALDKKNEAKVQQAIENIRKDLGQVTTVVIAHRLSTIRSADTILVMKKGKIVEKGDHDSLLRDFPTGIYAKLVQQQQQVDEDPAAEEESPDIRKETSKSDGEIEENNSLIEVKNPDDYRTGKNNNKSPAKSKNQIGIDPIDSISLNGPDGLTRKLSVKE